MFITNFYSKPFPLVEIYDRIRADVLVQRITDSVYQSMVLEQWFYNVLLRLSDYAYRLNNEERQCFISAALKQGFDLSVSSIANARLKSDEAVSEAYSALYDDDYDDDD